MGPAAYSVNNVFVLVFLCTLPPQGVCRPAGSVSCCYGLHFFLPAYYVGIIIAPSLGIYVWVYICAYLSTGVVLVAGSSEVIWSLASGVCQLPFWWL